MVDLMTEEVETFDTYYTDNPICPKCGHEDFFWTESCPIDVNDGSRYADTCPNCDEEYAVLVYVSYNFTTTKKPVDNPNEV